jgi:hypothetical protein
LQNKIETVLSHENDQTLTDIDKRLEELQTELLKLARPTMRMPQMRFIACVSRSKK